MLGATLGLIPAIILGIILFLINPIIGILWVLWLVGVAIFTVKKKKK